MASEKDVTNSITRWERVRGPFVLAYGILRMPLVAHIRNVDERPKDQRARAHMQSQH